MPTLRITGITCKGFNGSLKFRPHLGNQPVGNAIEASPNAKPIVIRFDPDDRLRLVKVDTQTPYTTGKIPTQKGKKGELRCDNTLPQQVLRVRYTVEA